MGEYTPTTDEAREWYQNGRFNDGLGDWDCTDEFDRWLADRDRATAERAWDEGFRAGFDVARWGGFPLLNPYRKEAPNE